MERVKSLDPFPRDGRVITYLVDNVDKGLSVASSDHIGRVPVREDCLDKRDSFILRNGTADQA
jgi:hypothetical protein